MTGDADSRTAAPGPVRVLLVDDDPLVRAGLSMILGGAPDVVVVGQAVDGVDALAQVRACRPDVVLMDIRMPRRDGLSATRELRRQNSPAKVIVLTTFDTDESVVEALQLGARGFLLKDTPPGDLVAAVRRVAAGEPMLSPTVTSRLIAAVTDPDRAGRRAAAERRLASLTDREREVAVAVGAGDSNADIAAALGMSVATVKSHLTHVFEKLGAENRVHVALVVHDAGLG